MKPGVYEQLITAATHDALSQLSPDLQAFERPVDSAEAPITLTRYLLSSLLRALDSLQEGQAPSHIVNQMLAQLAEITRPGAIEPGDYIHGELRELLAVVRKTGLTQPQSPQRPSLPLNATGLLVNARGEPRIGAEIEKELQSADRVDLLCSFLKWSGYRLVRRALEDFVARGGVLRVLTTCYLGATDAEVLEALAQLGQVRVSYDARRTRLHAKAWLFHRDSGFSTAYIGSSNLSSAALVEGLEWNVRLSQTENASVLDKFQATFDSYWEDGEFEPYRAGIDKSRFLSASRSERGETLNADYALDVRPYPFQQEILERLETERQLHGRRHNLVVAATGCGKTVIAALDYRRFRQQGGRARLLFVAHRDEILNQSLQTFRAVLRDGQFGERWTGQQVQEDHLHKESGCDLFFVTVRKSERDYSPTTMYQDYALSPNLFHWQSQSTTRADSKDGRRYQSHLGRTHALLFVREARKDERGQTGAYLFLGPAEYAGHQGERPMGITWRLRHRIPMEFYRAMKLAG